MIPLPIYCRNFASCLFLHFKLVYLHDGIHALLRISTRVSTWFTHVAVSVADTRALANEVNDGAPSSEKVRSRTAADEMAKKLEDFNDRTCTSNTTRCNEFNDPRCSVNPFLSTMMPRIVVSSRFRRAFFTPQKWRDVTSLSYWHRVDWKFLKSMN